MFAGYLFLRFKDGREIRQINPSQTLMNLQYHKGAELGYMFTCILNTNRKAYI